MSQVYQDFFRPDPTASNRNLKKFLSQEGLSLGFRDLVLVKSAAESHMYFSYALLEEWSEGELTSQSLAEVIECCSDLEILQERLQELDLGYSEPEEGLLLVGLREELSQETVVDAPNALVEVERVPTQAIFGKNMLSALPGSGGLWKEEELHADSMILLDGESSDLVIEAFRHLFRAAPNGSSRAAVVATALARHREDLNLEVADKMEEVSPPFGQALRQLYGDSEKQGSLALHFLLQAEVAPEPAAWVEFWRGVKSTVLESLAKREVGFTILSANLKLLAKTLELDPAERQILSHRLLEPLLERQADLDISGREVFLGLLVKWLQHDSRADKTIESRLELATDQKERILLGEALRRFYLEEDNQEALSGLVQRYATEAVSVGATADALSMSQLLRSFQAGALEPSALTDLSKLSHRQALIALEIWETLYDEGEAFADRVAELYVEALEQGGEHLPKLLKATLLQKRAVTEAFSTWCSGLDRKSLKQVVKVGYQWTLAAENRFLVAQTLNMLEWDSEELWKYEWSRTNLSYQKLGWLALTVGRKHLVFDEEVESRLQELVDEPVDNLYYWDLIEHCLGSGNLEPAFRERFLISVRVFWDKLDASRTESRAGLVKAVATALTFTEDPVGLLQSWTESLRSGNKSELWWVFVISQGAFSLQESFPNLDQAEVAQAARGFVTGLIKRLMSSGQASMQEIMAQAISDESDDLSLPVVLGLDLKNLGYEALGAVAAHPRCAPGVKSAIERRLALFLVTWANELAVTEDVYSYRSTPLFELLQTQINREAQPLQELIDDGVTALLSVQKRAPEKLRLEVRQACQHFLEHWISQRETSNSTAVAWRRVLDEVAELEYQEDPLDL